MGRDAGWIALEAGIAGGAHVILIPEMPYDEELRLRAGRPRQEAWKNLSDRTDLDSMRGLVSTLMQADQFGTSIANGLRVHSDVLRTQRRQEAEEQAAKTTVKLVFPLVLFIFPSLFVVVLGPSMIKLLDSFDKYLMF